MILRGRGRGSPTIGRRDARKDTRREVGDVYHVVGGRVFVEWKHRVSSQTITTITSTTTLLIHNHIHPNGPPPKQLPHHNHRLPPNLLLPPLPILPVLPNLYRLTGEPTGGKSTQSLTSPHLPPFHHRRLYQRLALRLRLGAASPPGRRRTTHRGRTVRRTCGMGGEGDVISRPSARVLGDLVGGEGCSAGWGGGGAG